ncbi:MAG: hypothetical protein IPJ45_17715 [Ignavibacteria bacterium]|nr:hypothetical protein [Ignavibacteria bacterium]
MISRSGGREIIISRPQKIQEISSTKPEAVNKWIEFVENDLNADISSLEERSRISIPIKKFDEMKNS